MIKIQICWYKNRQCDEQCFFREKRNPGGYPVYYICKINRMTGNSTDIPDKRKCKKGEWILSLKEVVIDDE